MSYSPPHTFVDGTTLTSTSLEGNLSALRVYLHSGIITGDIEAAQWIDTRHIQPPKYEPFTQVQHGVTGQQGGSDSGMIRLTFCTKYRSGQGRTSSNTFHEIPQTAIEIDARRACSMLFHYWWEVEAGPDQTDGAGTETVQDRSVWITPYVGNVSSARSTYVDHAQECSNNTDRGTGSIGWRDITPTGARTLYTLEGAYQSRDGTLLHTFGPGTTRFGLAAHSQMDRVGVVNWGVSIETFYL